MGDGVARPADERSRLDRALGVVAEVRAGEGLLALLLGLNLFFVLCSYYMLKTIREALILTEGGAAVKSYSSAAQAVLLIGLIPAFGAFASRVRRVVLLRGVALFFLSNVALFFLAGRAGLHVGVVFFIWVGIFNVMIVAQYWAFANDVFTPDQGKRLFAIVGLGSNVGAWLGAVWARPLIRMLGPYTLMIPAMALLLLCVVLGELVNRRHTARSPAEKAAEAESPLGKEGGFELIAKDRYLLLIALLIVLLNLVNTTGEYLLGRFVASEAVQRFGDGAATLGERQRFVGAFYAEFFAFANLASFLLQTFAVSRVIKYLGVTGALMVHPLLNLIGYLALARAPLLAVVRPVKLLDNTIDYSLGKTAQQALWLPTSREAKYKAKQAVDAFFMRVGDVLTAGLVFVGEQLAFSVPAFAAVNMALAMAWMGILARLAPENRRRMAESAARTA